jgi:predicted phage terminase large subunit-like protein
MKPQFQLSPAARLAIADARLRKDLHSFTRRAFEVVSPGETLHVNWHIEAMTHQLDQVRLGNLRRLIITIPPRNLKSITTSVAFPAFLLGHDPSKKIICVSYSADLAVKHAADFRTLMESEVYKRVFPETRISSRKNTELETLTTQRGFRYATSVGGTLTGRGGNVVILDDPMNPKQAMSETSRATVHAWFKQTLLSRLNMKTEDAIVVVMQRLHVDDLVGTLLEQGGWEHLDIPAIAPGPQRIPLGGERYYDRKAGEILDPVREPEHVLDELKAAMGTMDFSAQYLQRPVPLEGNLIKRSWLRFGPLPAEKKHGDLLVISWDTAMSETELSDYSVATVWHAQGDYKYLLDVVRCRFNYPDLKRNALVLRQRWPNATTLIEEKGSGISLIQDLRRQQVSVIGIKPETDKTTRLFATQPQFESGSVFFPNDAPWLDDLVAELLAFPGGKHDDQVDSLSQALTWIEKKRRVREFVFTIPILIPLARPYFP